VCKSFVTGREEGRGKRDKGQGKREKGKARARAKAKEEAGSLRE
jgi:hypothetical protein